MILKPADKFCQVQTMHVESDSEIALRAVCALALIEHKKASFYRVITNSDGSNTLELMWYKESNSIDLPFALDNVDALYSFLATWLSKSGIYPSSRPDTDGDSAKGFKAEDGWNGIVIKFTPHYIIYGK